MILKYIKKMGIEVTFNDQLLYLNNPLAHCDTVTLLGIFAPKLQVFLALLTELL